jgi:hypothetical protein
MRPRTAPDLTSLAVLALLAPATEASALHPPSCLRAFVPSSLPPPIYHNDLDDDPVGTYTVANLAADWNDPPWNNGVSEGRVSIIDGNDARSGRSLRVLYPAGTVGPWDNGAQWRLVLGQDHAELFCSYWLRFRPGFDFVLGGKLPGLVGGAANTGGDPPDGTDGWSARMMWRQKGKVVQYVYHPDQPGPFGEELPWDVGGQRYFTPGVWHHVEHRVVMNSPGRHDGLIQGWFDGELALDARGLRFRDVDSFAIDALYFSTFFGGSGPQWAPTVDETIDFDTVIISTFPVGPCRADVGGDGLVDVQDLLMLVTSWGPCPPGPSYCAADQDGNGVVDVVDLVLLLQSWGPCSGG